MRAEDFKLTPAPVAPRKPAPATAPSVLARAFIPDATFSRIMQEVERRPTSDGIGLLTEPELSDPTKPATMTHTCKCERFDLTIEDDRNKYADLQGRMVLDDCQKVWEERVQDGGKIIVYITYTMYVYMDNQLVRKAESKK